MLSDSFHHTIRNKDCGRCTFCNTTRYWEIYIINAFFILLFVCIVYMQNLYVLMAVISPDALIAPILLRLWHAANTGCRHSPDLPHYRLQSVWLLLEVSLGVSTQPPSLAAVRTFKTRARTHSRGCAQWQVHASVLHRSYLLNQLHHKHAEQWRNITFNHYWVDCVTHHWKTCSFPDFPLTGM